MFVNTAPCDMLKVDYMATNQLAALASKGPEESKEFTLLLTIYYKVI